MWSSWTCFIIKWEQKRDFQVRPEKKQIFFTQSDSKENLPEQTWSSPEILKLLAAARWKTGLLIWEMHLNTFWCKKQARTFLPIWHIRLEAAKGPLQNAGDGSQIRMKYQVWENKAKNWNIREMESAHADPSWS